MGYPLRMAVGKLDFHEETVKLYQPHYIHKDHLKCFEELNVKPNILGSLQGSLRAALQDPGCVTWSFL